MHFAPAQQNTRNSVFPHFLSRFPSRFRCTVAGQRPNKNGAKPHFQATHATVVHQLRTHSMAQNTHPKKENKFPLLAEKMKIYLHKL
ncbi:hypothetical protein CFter6_0829 [Collimonas fungivorans]|uniref:Uncharacterized protein n=1 Tax=Collimonas fungivorans TaxID=158899 RepID=A0A127P7C3_9BURK|nr:hypothetical protein CFter6_0829 [Collimonas fungivorans]